MASPYQAELELAKSAALKAGDIIRSYSNGNGGRSSNSATVCVKSVEYHVASNYPVLQRFLKVSNTHHHILSSYIITPSLKCNIYIHAYIAGCRSSNRG